MKKNGNVRLVKVDIKRWGSPVSEQYRINRIPTLWLYEGTKRTSTSTNAVLAALNR